MCIAQCTCICPLYLRVYTLMYMCIVIVYVMYVCVLMFVLVSILFCPSIASLLYAHMIYYITCMGMCILYK